MLIETESDGCKLCEIIAISAEDREIHDTLLDQTEHFQWVPGLGAFVEGYSMILSKEHIINTGCLNTADIEELECFIHKIKEVLYTIYKKKPIVFEHGSMGKRNPAGRSIEHHHIHIIPADLPLVPDSLSEDFVHRPIKSMKDLRPFNEEQIPYIYYSPASEEYYVFELPHSPKSPDYPPSQYLRRVLAAECGVPSGVPRGWDWRENRFTENIRSFVVKVRNLGVSN